jgi:hypothetical protein
MLEESLLDDISGDPALVVLVSLWSSSIKIGYIVEHNVGDACDCAAKR